MKKFSVVKKYFIILEIWFKHFVLSRLLIFRDNVMLLFCISSLKNLLIFLFRDLNFRSLKSCSNMTSKWLLLLIMITSFLYEEQFSIFFWMKLVPLVYLLCISNLVALYQTICPSYREHSSSSQLLWFMVYDTTEWKAMIIANETNEMKANWFIIRKDTHEIIFQFLQIPLGSFGKYPKNISSTSVNHT